jgi:hypothetical protein
VFVTETVIESFAHALPAVKADTTAIATNATSLLVSERDDLTKCVSIFMFVNSPFSCVRARG